MPRKRWLVPAIIVLLIAGLTTALTLSGPKDINLFGSSSDVRTTQSASAPATGPSVPAPAKTMHLVTHFTGTVDLREFSAECKRSDCWLPTQFQTGIVPGETVGKRDTWPKQDTKVLVFCQTTGDPYRNAAGQSVDGWYGIVVPKNQLDPAAAKRAVEMESVTGYSAYVGISWISGGEDLRAPDCV
jgi:hypothetical protein